MSINPFLNSERQLRNGWWILIFFLILAATLFPALLAARQNSMDVSIGLQAVIVMLASWICQLLRRRPLAELLGEFNLRWLKELGLGGLIGSALMLVPALILWVFGWVHWQWNPSGFLTFPSTLLLFAEVALAEELLFRGFIFQRLIAGLGQLPAQLLMAGYFLLTHLNNPGMTGDVKFFASINIFIASLVFGLSFIRTKSLAMPLGLHFMANLMQGGILGFGVSGTDQSGLFKPVFSEVPDWLTGGQFGLEASVPGLACVVVIFILFQRWDVSKTH
ncbi:MAG: CPBP family intramembrane metalloprotease [Anaerolineales bacterium]|jgi:membrane protease YdiL (CAAX protease family)|nr:CPBP family intramembrane metalloprotease [Anaerolineales bacterium]